VVFHADAGQLPDSDAASAAKKKLANGFTEQIYTQFHHPLQLGTGRRGSAFLLLALSTALVILGLGGQRAALLATVMRRT